MANKKLALLGGKPILKKGLTYFKSSMGKEEIAAVTKVIKGGVLSDFVGRAGEKFLGGKYVKELEKAYCKKFKVKHAVSFNSATTALHGAIAALGIGPGDEVIVPPMTMTSTATVILQNNAIPIFADIDEDTFCLDPKDVEKKISDRTRAIMPVNLFGQAADLDGIMKIAKKHNIKVIEDNAQSPGAKVGKKFAGTVGDIGVFSLNFHKVIHCGEGGVLVTNDDKLAFHAQLVRNHGEIVLDDLKDNDTVLIGTNYRLTEVQAAIAIEQLKKLDFLNRWRVKLAGRLTNKLKRFRGLIPAKVRENSTHVYYQYAIRFDENLAGIKRKTFADAIKAEGFSLGEGAVKKPLYALPIYQRQTIYKKGVKCPFSCPYYGKEIKYGKGLCPVDERMEEKELLLTPICTWPLTEKHIDLFISAVQKVFDNIEELKAYEKNRA
ncbi:MAG: DegT/DnrJ/EryC1/StrS family aminotransferase [Candidatus Parcubacteria bacterium]|nr:DegT/DnrJ/EryC1/StrS family aminotransferase [Candidatus Parcubacteria bacterium]